MDNYVPGKCVINEVIGQIKFFNMQTSVLIGSHTF